MNWLCNGPSWVCVHCGAKCMTARYNNAGMAGNYLTKMRKCEDCYSFHPPRGVPPVIFVPDVLRQIEPRWVQLNPPGS